MDVNAIHVDSNLHTEHSVLQTLCIIIGPHNFMFATYILHIFHYRIAHYILIVQSVKFSRYLAIQFVYLQCAS